METSEDMGQEDIDMAEADINKAEKDVAGADKERKGEEHTAEKEIKVMDQMPVAEDQETYRSLVKTVWIEDGPERRYSGTFEFIITRIAEEEIEGIIGVSI